MDEKKIGSVVVVENELPVGIFTERDLVKVVNKNVERIEHPIDGETVDTGFFIILVIVTGSPSYNVGSAVIRSHHYLRPANNC